MVDVREIDGRPYDASPRVVLDRVTARLGELGVTAYIAAELEFYLIDRERDGDGLPQPPPSARADSRQVFSMADLDSYAPFVDLTLAACRAQNIPANVAVSEYAPGQMEINLRHVDDPVLAADHAQLLQRVVKAVAQQCGLDATFMAKPYLHEEGNGLHFHVSLLDGDGRNLFDDGSENGSETLRHAIGGMKALLPESMAIFAPNVNSYRRMSQSLFANSAFSWASNNRMTSVRLPVASGPARRFEHRIAGADANPYLTLAAVLAAMHHGIAGRIDPGPPQEGDRRPPPSSEIPRDWASALDAMAKGEVLRDYLGGDYVDLYVATKRGEMERYYGTPTRLEYDWYLAAR
jgi:glutamine synthetase